MSKFKTIKDNVSAEIVEKKSKFIANIFYVETMEEADKIIKDIRKKYHDARHNCFAYIIETGDGEGAIVKYNDDGEPSGTAGAPMLNIIANEGMSNILVVVTRYFGGILLGTGGLVRAYSEAVQKALNSAEIIEKTKGYELKIITEYDKIEQLKYELKQRDIKIIDIQYLENIEVIVDIPHEKIDEFTNNANKEQVQNLKYDIIQEKYIDI